jgi:hypothetical protein
MTISRISGQQKVRIPIYSRIYMYLNDRFVNHYAVLNYIERSFRNVQSWALRPKVQFGLGGTDARRNVNKLWIDWR